MIRKTFTIGLAVAGIILAPAAWADDGDDPGWDDPGGEEPSFGDPEYCDWYGHELMETIEEEPTCQSPGFARYECTNCGETWSCELPIVDHYYENGVCRWCGATDPSASITYTYVPEVSPTCTNEGHIAYWLGSDGNFYNQQGGVVLQPSAVVQPALGHNWVAWQETTPATCTEAGEQTRTCTRSGCGASRTQTIAALGHVWSAWTVTTPATFTSTGEEERSCTRSGCTAHETREIPILERSEFTISTSGSKFIISRSDSTTSETVLYRTIPLTAFPGQHFTATNGVLTFAPGQTTTNVVVTERTPSFPFNYQTSSTRAYRFEIVDPAGLFVTNRLRNVSSGLTQFKNDKVSSSIANLVTLNSSGNFSSGMSSGKYLDVSYTPPSGQVEDSGTLNGYVLIDDEYDYKEKSATVSTSSLIDSTGATASHLNSLGYKIYATVCFTEKERDDGYQYLQIVPGTSSSRYDTGPDPNAKVNDPTNSVYKVCFEFADNSNAEGKAYFPHRGSSSGEFSNSAGKLHQQKYKSGCNGSGSVILPVTNTYITTRFDAGGSNNDTWGYKNLFVRMALCDSSNPSIRSGTVVSPGPYRHGTEFYVSVPFSEIVKTSGTPTLHTDWGDLKCLSTSDANVLTFRGTITANVGTPLYVRYIKGTVTDLVGNALVNTNVNASFSCTVDYPWTGSGTAADPCVITTTNQLNYLASSVNNGVTNYANTCFALGANIAYSHTTSWNVSSTENNYTGIGCHGRSFRGNFDGRGHTVSGIRIYRSGSLDADGSQGLFGFISVGSVKNVILADARITGHVNCGAIVGYNSGTLATNYYRDVSVNNATTNIGTGNSGDLPGARSVHTLALAPDISIVSAETSVKITNATYYAAGSTITLAYGGTSPFGYTFSGYTVNGTAISGDTFTMPAADSSIIANCTPVTFPAYLDDAPGNVRSNYLAWATQYGPDVDGTHEAAFLLDISPTTPIPEGAALFKVVELGTTNILTSATDFGLIAQAMGYTGEYLPCRRIVLASDVTDLWRRTDFDTPFEICNGYLVLRIGADLSLPTSAWQAFSWFVEFEGGRAEVVFPELFMEGIRSNFERVAGKPLGGLFLRIGISAVPSLEWIESLGVLIAEP